MTVEHCFLDRPECILMRHYIQSIGDIIYHQMPLKEQDQWLNDMIEFGLYVVEEGE